MSNAIDLLLTLDAGKLELPTKEYNIKRLSEAVGSPVIFTIQGIGQDKLDAIRDMATSIDPSTKEMKMDMSEIRLATVVEGVKSPDLRDKALMEKQGVKTPYSLVKKLLSAGEIEYLYDYISKLSGYDEDAIEEVKKP